MNEEEQAPLLIKCFVSAILIGIQCCYNRAIMSESLLSIRVFGSSTQSLCLCNTSVKAFLIRGKKNQVYTVLPAEYPQDTALLRLV